ncbi:hypothetical protein EO087_00265 [Dyella sp. M7H15-1]|nr:hypothetical protein EO087_00265 [Dyella sp. M7H15-1]
MLSGEKQQLAESMRQQMSKVVELRGGLTSSLRAKEIVDAVFKAVQSSGGMVSARDLRQFQTQGGTAVTQFSDRVVMGQLEPIMGEFGGSSTGTAFQTAFNRTHGILSLVPSLLANEAVKLGVWDKQKLIPGNRGGFRVNGDPLDKGLADLEAKDPTQFAEKLMSIYQAHGVKDWTSIARENEILLGRTGGRVYTKMMQQLPVMMRASVAYDKSLSPDQILKTPEAANLLAVTKLKKAWEDFNTTLGNSSNIMNTVASRLGKLTGVLKWLNTEAGKHPKMASFAVNTWLGLTAGAMLGGAMRILWGGLKSFQLMGDAAKGLVRWTKLWAMGRQLKNGGRTIGFFESKFWKIVDAVKIAGGAVWRLGGRLINLARRIPMGWMGRLGRGFVSLAGRAAGLLCTLPGVISGLGSLITKLPGMAVGLQAVAVAGAAILGWEVGKLINKHLIEGTTAGRKFGDWIGSAEAHVMAFFGSSVAQEAIDRDAKAKQSMRETDQKLYEIQAARNLNQWRAHLADYFQSQSSQTVQVNSKVYLNEREVGRAVTQHQTREASRPQTGMSSFDSSMMPGPIGYVGG